MACLHMGRSPLLDFRWGLYLSSTTDFKLSSRFFRRQHKTRNLRSLQLTRFRLCCRLQDADSQSSSEEPPESLFMKELKRRGMTPASSLEDSNRDFDSPEESEMKLKEDSFIKRSTVVSTEYEKSLANQRERSMALNSEGLEGLIPRAKLLLTLGGTFFLAFWPLILITITFFAVLYIYFGPDFVHDARNSPVGPPPYIDPYQLLTDERLSQTAPPLQ